MNGNRTLTSNKTISHGLSNIINEAAAVHAALMKIVELGYASKEIAAAAWERHIQDMDLASRILRLQPVNEV